MKAPIAAMDELDEEQLKAVVLAFYARVRRDEMIGPLFNAAVEDWDEHLDRLTRFWSSVMLTSGRYKGNPMVVHRRHAEAIAPSMFDRWLELWAEITDELMPAAAAAALQSKAGHIAESLKLGLFFRLPPRADRAGAPAGS